MHTLLNDLDKAKVWTAVSCFIQVISCSFVSGLKKIASTEASRLDPENIAIRNELRKLAQLFKVGNPVLC